MHIRTISKLVSVAAALAVLACSGAKQPDEEFGGVNVAVNASATTAAPAPTAVYVQITGTTARGAAFSQLVQAYLEGGIYEIRLNRMPAGTYSLHGLAYVDPAAVPGVDPTDWESLLPDPVAVITSKQTTTVALRLQQTTPPNTVNNNAPTIDSIVASQYLVDSTLGAMDVISLVATASDLNLGNPAFPGEALSFMWADNVGGTFANYTALSTTWTPPADFTGIATLTLTVYDAQMAASAVSLRFDVSPGNARGVLVVSPIEINNWPDIVSITADNAQILPGGSATLVADVIDADNDPISYAWTESCTGTLSGVSSFVPVSGSVTGTSLGASFATVYTPPTGALVCTLTLAIADGRGGTNTGTFVVNVRAAPVAYAPDFTQAIMSPSGLPPTPILGGSNVNFQVAATEPLASGGSIPTAQFIWAATVNGVPLPASVFTDLSGTSGARMVLAVPACTVAGTFDYAIRSTAVGSRPFTVANDSFIDFGFTVTCP